MKPKQSQQTGRLRLSHLREVNEAHGEEMAAERGRFHRLAREDSAPKVFSSFNLFPTPPTLADRLIDLADIRAGHKVLEPSAGTGRLLDAIARKFGNPYEHHIEATAVEMDGPLWHHLSDSSFAMWTNARLADFLTWTTDERFDRIVANPPFRMGADVLHIERMQTLLKPKGRLVSICGTGSKRQQIFDIATEVVYLPRGSFRSEGTGVDAAIVVIDG